SIVGPSGAGKSTLLQILGTLDTPDAGTLEIMGKNPFKLDSKSLASFRNSHIGFVFQFHHLLPEFTALENVILPMIYAGVPPAERRLRAEAALERVGLAHRLENRPNQLSGG
ncbi:MAG: ABC transporter ATP-binding protein, partial [bacterium]